MSWDGCRVRAAGAPPLGVGPLSDRILQPRLSSADSTSRTLIPLTTSQILFPLDSNDPGGIDGLWDAVDRRSEVTGGRTSDFQDSGAEEQATVGR